MKKIIIPIIAALTFTTMSTFASSSDIKTTNDDSINKSYINKMKEMKMKDNIKKPYEQKKEIKKIISDSIQAAIKNNDYDAFVIAFNEQLAKITTPTKEEFAKKVEEFAKKMLNDKYAPIQAAIQANDYDAFVIAFKEFKWANNTEIIVPTKEEFAKKVEEFAKKMLNDKYTPIQAAIQANDYDAFVIAFEANKPTVPTKEEFAKIVALKQTITDNKIEIKTIKNEVKEWKTTKDEAKEKIISIKNENKEIKKEKRLAKRPLRKVWRLSK